MTDFTTTELAMFFSEQAEWREQKAAEFPDDERNIDAARKLRNLAKTADDVPEDLLKTAADLNTDADDLEVWNEMIRQVGFWSFPETAEDFLKEFIANRSRNRAS